MAFPLARAGSCPLAASRQPGQIGSIMFTNKALRWVAGSTLAAFLVLSRGMAGPRSAQVRQDRTRGEFMRKKLDYTQGIIEGLALENFSLISENARKLKVLSQAAEWEVSYIPNVEMYVPYTTEFQRLCDELATNARRPQHRRRHPVVHGAHHELRELPQIRPRSLEVAPAWAHEPCGLPFPKCGSTPSSWKLLKQRSRTASLSASRPADRLSGSVHARQAFHLL